MKRIYTRSAHILAIIILLSIVIMQQSCEEKVEKSCKDSQEGVLVNLTEFDGCGWIIQLRNSTRLEPINLNDFDIELVENKSVCIQYQIRTDLASICMVGQIVEITSIEEYAQSTLN